MMIPSIVLLYSSEENLLPDVTVKVIGHQWYWEFEYPAVARDEAKLKGEE